MRYQYLNKDNKISAYLIIGVIIILIFIFKDAGDSKKAIEEGRGDEESSKIMWGEHQGHSKSHNEEYSGKIIGIVIFIIALLFVLFNN